MAEALYRVYRPQFFRDIQGQIANNTALTQQLIAGRIGHAYLFAGTRGTGKTTTARVFARAANCHARDATTGEPCGTCPSCLDIAAGRSVDVIELDAATHTGVDTVREEIIENARILPTRDRYKIFIIDEVHMLSTSSFNALLKSLEEPPAHVIYILATTELHKVPATVASRCQKFIFRPLPAAAMREKIQKIAAAENLEVAPSVVQRLIAASGGAMRDAESLLGQMRALSNSHITDVEADIVLPPTHFFASLALLEQLHANDMSAAFAHIQKLFDDGVDLTIFFDQLIRHAHELLVVTTTKDVPAFLGVFTDEEIATLKKTASQISAAWLAHALDVFLQKKQLHKTIASPFVPIHVACTELCTSYPTAVRSKEEPIPAVQVSSPPKQQKPDVPVPPPQHTAEHKQPPPTDDELTDRVRSVWTAATQALAATYPSIGIFLSAATVTAARGNEVVLSVNFPLYQTKLAEPKIKNLMDAELSRLVGAQLVTSIILEQAETPTEGPAADVISALGGKIVG